MRGLMPLGYSDLVLWAGPHYTMCKVRHGGGRLPSIVGALSVNERPESRGVVHVEVGDEHVGGLGGREDGVQVIAVHHAPQHRQRLQPE